MSGENLQAYTVYFYSMTCWTCGKTTTVLMGARDTWDNYPRQILVQIRKKYPHFHKDYSFTIGESYDMNHCEHCHAKLGDWYIEEEILLCERKPYACEQFYARALR